MLKRAPRGSHWAFEPIPAKAEWLRKKFPEVEVREIRPPSEFDGLFRQAAQETLADWRYAPAIRGGEPVAALLEWTIQFPSRETRQEDPAGSLVMGSSGRGAGT